MFEIRETAFLIKKNSSVGIASSRVELHSNNSSLFLSYYQQQGVF